MNVFTWGRTKTQNSEKTIQPLTLGSGETRPQSNSFAPINRQESLPNPTAKPPRGKAYDDFNFVKLLKGSGIGCESHKVTTRDGYILRVFRLVNQNYSPVKRLMLKPVLLQHGILDSSDNWVINGDENSLGIYLAKRE